jgi:lipopolysaccharide/colanic/teichoic acid biosynthesis glycosyltransferase
MPHLVERMGDDQRLARRPLRPGMTGLWQVSVDAKGLMYEHP